MPRISKAIETENRLAVGRGERKMGSDGALEGGDEKMLEPESL